VGTVLTRVSSLPESLPKKARPLVNDYFKLVLERNLAGAERSLAEIRKVLKETRWEQGYLNALEGMLVAERSGDTRYVYLSRLDLKNQRKIEEVRRCFQAESRNPLEGEFDRGFFSAWSEFLRMAKSSLDSGKGEKPETLDVFLEE